jgi:hypothetical protein
MPNSTIQGSARIRTSVKDARVKARSRMSHSSTCRPPGPEIVTRAVHLFKLLLIRRRYREPVAATPEPLTYINKKKASEQTVPQRAN